MASELARTLAISGDEAADKLLNLSPYETKVGFTTPSPPPLPPLASSSRQGRWEQSRELLAVFNDQKFEVP